MIKLEALRPFLSSGRMIHLVTSTHRDTDAERYYTAPTWERLVGEAESRFSCALQMAGFRISSTPMDLDVAASYSEPIRIHSEYRTCLRVRDMSGEELLSEKRISFPSNVPGSELVDWAREVPLLVAVLSDNPTPLMLAVLGTFGDGESAAALQLWRFPTVELVRFALEVCREKTGVPDPYVIARIIRETGQFPISVAELLNIRHRSAVTEGAFQSLIQMIGSTASPALIAEVAQRPEWLLEHSQSLIWALENQYDDSGQRIGAALLLGELANVDAILALQKCVDTTKDKRLKEVATTLLHKLG